MASFYLPRNKLKEDGPKSGEIRLKPKLYIITDIDSDSKVKFISIESKFNITTNNNKDNISKNINNSNNKNDNNNLGNDDINDNTLLCAQSETSSNSLHLHVLNNQKRNNQKLTENSNENSNNNNNNNNDEKNHIEYSIRFHVESNTNAPPIGENYEVQTIAENSKKIKNSYYLHYPNEGIIQDERHIINPRLLHDYLIIGELGHGGFGFVMSAIRRSDGKECAIKFIREGKIPLDKWISNPDYTEEIKSIQGYEYNEPNKIPYELYVLKMAIKSKNPNMIELLDYFVDITYPFIAIVTEIFGYPWSIHSLDTRDIMAKIKHYKNYQFKIKSIPGDSSLYGLNSFKLKELGIPSLNQFDILNDSYSIFKQANHNSTKNLQIGTEYNKYGIKNQCNEHTELLFKIYLKQPRFDLFEFIDCKKRLSETESLQILHQLIDNLMFLRATLGIIHRDIKDDNILIDENLKIKLIDFGSATPVAYFNNINRSIRDSASEMIISNTIASLAKHFEKKQEINNKSKLSENKVGSPHKKSHLTLTPYSTEKNQSSISEQNKPLKAHSLPKSAQNIVSQPSKQINQQSDSSKLDLSPSRLDQDHTKAESKSNKYDDTGLAKLIIQKPAEYSSSNYDSTTSSNYSSSSIENSSKVIKTNSDIFAEEKKRFKEQVNMSKCFSLPTSKIEYSESNNDLNSKLVASGSSNEFSLKKDNSFEKTKKPFITPSFDFIAGQSSKSDKSNLKTNNNKSDVSGTQNNHNTGVIENKKALSEHLECNSTYKNRSSPASSNKTNTNQLSSFSTGILPHSFQHVHMSAYMTRTFAGTVEFAPPECIHSATKYLRPSLDYHTNFLQPNNPYNVQIANIEKAKIKARFSLNRLEPYDAEKAEIWTLGTVFYSCLNGVMPYNNVKNIGTYPWSCLRHVHEELRQETIKLLQDLLCIDPLKRCSLFTAATHPSWEAMGISYPNLYFSFPPNSYN